MAKLKVQLVNANAVPSAPLKIDEEKRAIQQILGSKAVVKDCPAARLPDVISAVRTNRPNIIHFSAHGCPTGEILLLDESGQAKPIALDSLKQLFGLEPDSVDLVILNACFSARQAEQISKYVRCVFGIEKTIPDVAAALQFTAQFYQALLEEPNVALAYERVDIIATNERLPSERRWQKQVRPGTDLSQLVLFQRRKRTNSLAGNTAVGMNKAAKAHLLEKQILFKQNLNLLGVKAEYSSLTKTCRADGSGTLVYDLRELSVEEGQLDGLYLFIETTAGAVGELVPDDRATKLGMWWVPEPNGKAKDIGDLIKQIGSLRGALRFGQPLNRESGPYSFGWTVKIVNLDAVTLWDFENLYEPADQRHVNDNQIVPAGEYYARLVWFPVKRLEVLLNLPPGHPEPPRLRYFKMKGSPQIPRTSVRIQQTEPAGAHPGELLRSFPPRDAWYEEHAKWDADFKVETLESASLKLVKDSAHLAIDYPLVGSYYSIDWCLQNSSVDGEFEDLVRQAQEIWRALLEHRERRRTSQELNSASKAIVDILHDLHTDLRKKFKSSAPNEQFETALLAYDKSLRRLVVADGHLSGGELNARKWDFWLPFGLGLGGACFRRGSETLRFLKPIAGIPKSADPEFYLPLPGSIDFECLIAIPINHPDFDPDTYKIPDAEWSRQLLGVFTVGSNNGASPLIRLCKKQMTATILDELKHLREQCINACHRIALCLV